MKRCTADIKGKVRSVVWSFMVLWFLSWRRDIWETWMSNLWIALDMVLLGYRPLFSSSVDSVTLRAHPVQGSVNPIALAGRAGTGSYIGTVAIRWGKRSQFQESEGGKERGIFCCLVVLLILGTGPAYMQTFSPLDPWTRAFLEYFQGARECRVRVSWPR